MCQYLKFTLPAITYHKNKENPVLINVSSHCRKPLRKNVSNYLRRPIKDNAPGLHRYPFRVSVSNHV